MPLHPKVISYSTFKGINNKLDPEHTPKEYLKKALNIDLDITGSVSIREGYTKVDSANFTSLWASRRGNGCYATRNGDLVLINKNYSYTTLLSGVGSAKISFDEVDDIIYFASDNVTGIIQGGILSSWGIPKNNLSPSVTFGTGNLSAGTYQIAFTYVRNDGIESGTGVASLVNAPSKSSIIFTAPTITDPSILYTRVYLSTLSSSVLYYMGTALSGSTLNMGSVSENVNPLRLFNVDAAPTGHIVKYYKGRMYVAQGNILWYSEPFQYQHFRLDSNYIEFPQRITEVMPVEDGIWIGCDRLYLLMGESPDNFRRAIKDNVVIVEGTSTLVSKSFNIVAQVGDTTTNPKTSEYRWIVSSDMGIYSLGNQGEAMNLTVENVEFAQADKGSSLFLESYGMNQYLSILKTNTNPNNSVLGDLVESTIVRNGIIIK
jgi:hypothetical protein